MLQLMEIVQHNELKMRHSKDKMEHFKDKCRIKNSIHANRG